MSNELELNKDRADADRYYKLFADKVGKIEDGERSLFIHIGNFDVLDKFIQSNPNCSYYIIDQHLNGLWFKMSWSCKFLGSKENEEIIEKIETLNMKFDKIIMNPPYSQGLHVKILKEAISHLSKNGQILSLEPIDKWQKAELFGNEIPVENTFVTKRISMDDACKIFGINQRTDLGIVTNSNTKAEKADVLDNQALLEKIKKGLDKAVKIGGLLKDRFEKTWKEYPIAFGYGCTLAGNGGHGKACWHITGRDFERSTRKEEIGHSIRFNAKSKKEQQRVHKFYNDPMMLFIYKEFGFGNAPYNIIPYLSGFVDKNGKTALDYDWTFENLCIYFNLTIDDLVVVKNSLNDFLYEDEQKLIEETMEKYK